MKIGIIFAMDSELNAFMQYFNDVKTVNHPVYEVYEIVHDTHELYAIQSGIGKVNAAMITTWFLNNYRVDYLINTGIAGGVNIEVLKTVLATELVYHDVDVTPFEYEIGQIPLMPQTFKTDPVLMDLFEKSVKDKAYLKGVIASGDQFMTSLNPLQSFLNHFPTLYAVDMESAAIAQVAYRLDIPFLSFRVISDVLESNTQVDDTATVKKATLKSGEILKDFIDGL